MAWKGSQSLLTLILGLANVLMLDLAMAANENVGGSVEGRAEHSETIGENRPNVILMMADDLGWGDTGFNGHPVIKTPNLDQMAADGLKMNRFYAASAVCSPTRASCLTGRSPYRTGVFSANVGILRPEETTLPEILKQQGYLTGHFGKWHLGALTDQEKDANRGRPGGTRLLNPPADHGYDDCFVTESKVPTWDPMKLPRSFGPEESKGLGWLPLQEDADWESYGTSYWNIHGEKVTENLAGDDSRVIMDRVLPFIDQAIDAEKPFLAVVWFHAPHLPCVAGPEFQKMYQQHPLELRNYAGCITAMDQQIGRLRQHLTTKGVSDNTMIWFCSDNGPEGKANGQNGTAGPFQGRKRDLLEGGVRVPGVLVWPRYLSAGRETDVPCSTYDFLPTILDALQTTYPHADRTLDGESLLPLIDGEQQVRQQPIGQMLGRSLAWHQGPWKLLSTNGGKQIRLFDIIHDPAESTDLSHSQAAELVRLKDAALQWQKETKQSFEGKDYGKKSVQRMQQKWRPAIENP